MLTCQKEQPLWAPLVLHTQENSTNPSTLPLSARGTYSDLSSSSPATCGWEMLPVFCLLYIRTQSPGSPEVSLPLPPPSAAMADDLIASSSFLPHNAQHARGTLFCFLVAMSHTWSPCLLISLCALYSTKLRVPKQQGICNARPL